jgi:TIR domain-containing protein
LAAVSEYYFYLSYARTDYDSYLARFYEDLATEIRMLTADREDRIAFFDRIRLELADDWSEQLKEALQSTRTLVPVYSPAYFQSEFCGKEWQVFHSRLEKFVAKSPTGTPFPPLIKPVLWSSPEAIMPLPEPASQIQQIPAYATEAYRRDGLRYMKKLQRYEDEYVNFVYRFAAEIVDAAKLYQLPRTNLSLQKATSPLGGSVQPATSLESGKAGVTGVQFVYVVARQGEISQVRDEVLGYGEGEIGQWLPFLPESTVGPWLIAQREASNERLTSEMSALDETLINRIRTSHHSYSPIVLLVDAWTLLLKKYRSIISEFSRYSFDNCAVIIVGTPAGPSEGLSAPPPASVIQELYGDKRPWKVYEASSEKELVRAMQKALAAIRKRLLTRAMEISGSKQATVPQPTIPLPALK